LARDEPSPTGRSVRSRLHGERHDDEREVPDEEHDAGRVG